MVRVLLLDPEDHVWVSVLILEDRSEAQLGIAVRLPRSTKMSALTVCIGVYGLKPTSGRLPNSGCKAVGGGQEQIIPTIGPLSTSLEGIKTFTKTLIDAQPWLHEPTMLPFPWKEEDFFSSRKLKIAVIWDDGVVKPHPPVTRALKQVVERLSTSEKVEIVDWTPYQHERAWEIIVRGCHSFKILKLTC